MNSDTLDDEAISSYLSFTNTSDIQAARNALRLANGNLEAAVEAYLDSIAIPHRAYYRITSGHTNNYRLMTLLNQIDISFLPLPAPLILQEDLGRPERSNLLPSPGARIQKYSASFSDSALGLLG